MSATAGAGDAKSAAASAINDASTAASMMESKSSSFEPLTPREFCKRYGFRLADYDSRARAETMARLKQCFLGNDLGYVSTRKSAF